MKKMKDTLLGIVSVLIFITIFGVLISAIVVPLVLVSTNPNDYKQPDRYEAKQEKEKIIAKGKLEEILGDSTVKIDGSIITNVHIKDGARIGAYYEVIQIATFAGYSRWLE